VSEVIVAAVKDELEEAMEVIVPETLISNEQLQTISKGQKVDFVEFVPKRVGEGPAEASLPVSVVKDASTGVVQRLLANGIAVNIKSLDTEPQRGCIRVAVPGGRTSEPTDKPGAMLVGAKTIQEGGAFGTHSREEVELFCIDHLLIVEIISQQDMFFVDLMFPTTRWAHVDTFTMHVRRAALYIALRSVESLTSLRAVCAAEEPQVK
jgi:hypothetical protein